MEDREILLSTKAQIEEFFNESFVWKDIVNELNNLSRLAQLEYDVVGEPHIDDSGYKIVPNSSETLIHLGDIKGRRKAVNFFLSLPSIFLSTFEEKKDVTGRNQTD